jgi:NAD+ kinase
LNKSFSSIGIIGKRDDARVEQMALGLRDHLTERAITVLLDEQTSHQFSGWDGELCPRDALGERCDLVIVIGGDGTLLDAGRNVCDSDTPLLGINLGRLGFMVDVLPAEMLETLDEVLRGEYVREPRLMLSASVEHEDAGLGTCGPMYALNDVVIRNKESARVLEFDTFMDGDFISRHRADGIVIASPTGSTAYALSGGGPVLHPGLSALTLVPICPHTLSDRPLVVDAKHTIEVVVAPDEGMNAVFTADGQTHQTVSGGDRIVIRRSPRSLTLIHPRGYDYFNILRNKLHWGRGQREYPPAPD